MTDPTEPLTDQQLAVEAGRATVRAKFSGGAFPAALGRAIADELADAAMAPLLADNARLRAELALRDTAFEAVLAMDDDVNTLFSLGQIARTYTRTLATPVCTCRAEPVHQAGCQPA